MADVYAVFGTLLALGIVFPGMLTAWWLMFPRVVGRAAECLDQSAWSCLAIGAALAAAATISSAALAAVPLGLIKVFGLLLGIAALGLASLGAAGVAALLGGRLTDRSGAGLSPLAGFLRGALALELAAAFPLIGWLLTIPAITLLSLGAASRAVLGVRGQQRPSAAGLAAESQA